MVFCFFFPHFIVFFFPRRTLASQSVDGLGAVGGRGVLPAGLPGAAGSEPEGLLLFLSLKSKLWGRSVALVSSCVCSECRGAVPQPGCRGWQRSPVLLSLSLAHYFIGEALLSGLLLKKPSARACSLPVQPVSPGADPSNSPSRRCSGGDACPSLCLAGVPGLWQGAGAWLSWGG